MFFILDGNIDVFILDVIILWFRVVFFEIYDVIECGDNRLIMVIIDFIFYLVLGIEFFLFCFLVFLWS